MRFGVFVALAAMLITAGCGRLENRSVSGTPMLARGLTRFDRHIIDQHKQLYGMSCIPSSVEMVLKLTGRVPPSYYELQAQWENKSDGSFGDFNGRTIAGLTFHQRFTMPRDDNFPLEALFEEIHRELVAGRFVIVGLAAGPDWHNWVIYDEDANGEFLAVSKSATGTIDELQVKKAIARMKGTDIGTYGELAPTMNATEGGPTVQGQNTPTEKHKSINTI